MATSRSGLTGAVADPWECSRSISAPMARTDGSILAPSFVFGGSLPSAAAAARIIPALHRAHALDRLIDHGPGRGLRGRTSGLSWCGSRSPCPAAHQARGRRCLCRVPSRRLASSRLRIRRAVVAAVETSPEFKEGLDRRTAEAAPCRAVKHGVGHDGVLLALASALLVDAAARFASAAHGACHPPGEWWAVAAVAVRRGSDSPSPGPQVPPRARNPTFAPPGQREEASSAVRLQGILLALFVGPLAHWPIGRGWKLS